MKMEVPGIERVVKTLEKMAIDVGGLLWVDETLMDHLNGKRLYVKFYRYFFPSFVRFSISHKDAILHEPNWSSMASNSLLTNNIPNLCKDMTNGCVFKTVVGEE